MMLRIFQAGRTPKHPCSYLPDRIAQLEVMKIAEVSEDADEQTLALGIRRFGRTYFRPICKECRACTPLRVLAQDFRASKNQRRVRQKNRDLQLVIVQAEKSTDPQKQSAHLDLYMRYHHERSQNRGWPQPEKAELMQNYTRSFLDNPVLTWEFRYLLDGKLVGVGYFGETDKSLNAIYAFYDPALKSRSLGTFNVLTAIDRAKQHAKQYVYLGYHVEGCASLAYKANFHPHQVLLNGQWQHR